MLICKKAIIGLLLHQVFVGAQNNEYLCSRTTKTGEVSEVILDDLKAEECKNDQINFDSCSCELTRVTCLFGPDSRGQFSTASVTPAQAKACDPESCICSDNEQYLEVGKQRIESVVSIDEKRNTLVKEFEEAIANDNLSDKTIEDSS